MVNIGAMVDARFFITWGLISSGPDALHTWSFSSIFLTPGSMIPISSNSGYGDVSGSRLFVRGPYRVKTDSNCWLSSFALSLGHYVIHWLTRRSLWKAPGGGIVFLKMRKDSHWVNPGAHAGAAQPASSWATAPSHCPQIPCLTPCWAIIVKNAEPILPAAAQHRFP